MLQHSELKNKGFSSFDVGGLIGTIYYGEVNDCYVRGVVRGNNTAGGFVARSIGGEINRCYADCNISGITFVGGFAGDSQVNPATDFNGCFWNEEKEPNLPGVGNVSEPNVIGKTTAELMTESTFTSAGWDFVGESANGTEDIWTICEGTNYPKFVWQISAADFVCPDGVTFSDYSVLGAAWLSDPNYPNWNPVCDISEPKDDIINWQDFAVFAQDWLAGVE